MISILFIALSGFAAAFAVTGVIRRFCVARGMMDIPSERSLHVDAVPRGGGMGFVVAFLLLSGALAGTRMVPMTAVIGIGAGGLFLASVGWLDDWHPLTRTSRIIAHFVAAGCSLAWLGWPLDFGAFGWFGRLLELVAIVWFSNLYNFMDGIDGLAAVEAASAAAGLGFLLLLSGSAGAAAWCIALAACAAGFLPWNWPPAKIFMGDCGSVFLGFTLSMILLVVSREDGRLFWPGTILLAVFVVDATVTLLGRIARREIWYEAHCTHAYQHAARRWGHKRVTLAVGCINIFGLFPVALAVWRRPQFGPWAALSAYTALAALSAGIGAGRETPAIPTREQAVLVVKRCLDVSSSIAALLLCSPLFALVSILIVLDSGLPVFYTQERVGRSFRRFRILKFRTMRNAAPGLAITVAGDRRVTRIGRILRASKLDELPQLWNVLVGDMSLVGPRPEIPEYVDLFRARYQRVLAVRPGITDFGSIAFRHEEDLLARSSDPLREYVQRILPAKLELAEKYLHTRSLYTDVSIIVRTLLVTCRRPAESLPPAGATRTGG